MWRTQDIPARRATALAMVTPVIGALLHWRKPLRVEPTQASPPAATSDAG